MVAQLREIEYPVRLTKAQLSFLLTLFDAQVVQGLVDESILPADEKAREQIFDQGQREMLAEGWMVAQQPTGHHLNDVLGLLGAVIAAPQVVILTERKKFGYEDGVSHYIAGDIYVELSQRDRYEITGLANLEILALRLGNFLELPTSTVQPMQFTLNVSDIEQAKHAPNSAFLVERGLSPEVAQLFVTTYQNTDHSASIKIVRTVAGEGVAVDSLGVLVGTNGVAFWAIPLDDQTLEYHLTDLQGFVQQLTTMINRVRTQPIHK